MIRRWYLVLRARLGLPPKAKPDPCEVCGRRKKRNVTLTSEGMASDLDPNPRLAMGGYSISATFCRTHAPKEHVDA